MKAINPNEIKDNFIELIGKEWMLVSAGDKEKFNMMTASWGRRGSVMEPSGGVCLYSSGALYP